jgi:CBS domain-containing protein
MKIHSVMNKHVESIAPTASLVDASRQMARHDIGFLPVVRDAQLVGVVTDRDIVVRCIAEGKDPEATTAEDIMTMEVVCCFRDDLGEHVMQVMLDHGVRRLAVIDHEHRLVGLVSAADLGGGHVPRKKSVKVQFHKVKTDSHGMPHEVLLKTVYVTGVGGKEEAQAKAVKRMEEETGTVWTNVATRVESREETEDRGSTSR